MFQDIFTGFKASPSDPADVQFQKNLFRIGCLEHPIHHQHTIFPVKFSPVIMIGEDASVGMGGIAEFAASFAKASQFATKSYMILTVRR